MSLTKEECLEAYEVIDTLVHLMCGETREDGYEPTMDETINSMCILKQIIDKHFDNPPLKFEELKPNMWVWDNKIKEFRKIDRVNKMYHGIEYFNTYGWFIEFEENRFYRREVKEDAQRTD